MGRIKDSIMELYAEQLRKESEYSVGEEWKLQGGIIRTLNNVIELCSELLKREIEAGNLKSGEEIYTVKRSMRELIQRFQLTDGTDIMLEKQETGDVVKVKLVENNEEIVARTLGLRGAFSKIMQLIPSSAIEWAVEEHDPKTHSYKLVYLLRRREFQRKLQMLAGEGERIFWLPEITKGIDDLIKEAGELKVAVKPCPTCGKTYIFMF